MNSPSFDAYLFDLDGTLLDSVPQYEEADREYFLNLGVHISHEDFQEVYMGGWDLTDQWFLRAGIFLADLPRRKHERAQIYRRVLAEKVDMYADADGVLAELRTNHKTAIVTAAPRMCVDLVDERIGIRKKVHMIVTADDVQFQKPDPEGLLLASTHLEIPPERCAYVGDLPSDLKAAEAAGKFPILIKREHTPQGAERFAKRVITSLRELLG